MKKVSSIVWQFFDRIEENKRCIAVLCKLCENEYKYFGNTTNLRVHLAKKHPIQWELRQSNIEISPVPARDREDANSISSAKRRQYVDCGYTLSIKAPDSGSVDEDSMPRIEIQRVDVESCSEADAQDNSVHHTNEEWLDEDYQNIDIFEPKRQRLTKIKREITTPPKQLPTSYAVESSHVSDNSVRLDKDEFTVFGEYIANKLRKLKKPRTQGNIQQIFTTILWQAEYGLYDEADSVKRVLMWEANSKNTDQQNNIQDIESEDNSTSVLSVDTEQSTQHVELKTSEASED